MQSAKNGKDVISTRKVSNTEAIRLLSKFLNKEEARRQSLDSVVYLKENIIEQLTRVRDSLVKEGEESQSQLQFKSDQQ